MNEVKDYLSNTTVNAPFFLVAGDGNYASVKTGLLELGLKQVSVSSYCSAADKPPSLDNLIDTFSFADIDGSSTDKKIMVLGLGEYLALRGEKEAFKWLSKIKDTKVGNARIVLLLRGVTFLVQKLQAADPARFSKSRVLFTDDVYSDINVALVPSTLNLSTKNGIKGLLTELEKGKTTVSVKTNATFDNSMFLVRQVKSVYDGVKHIRPTFPIAESFGTSEQWKEFLTSLTACRDEINAVIDVFGNDPKISFLNYINGTAYKNWLYFIAL